MKFSRESAEKIQRTIDEFVADPERFFDGAETLDLGKTAAELNVLPLCLDWSGAFGLRPSGEIISFSYEKPFEIRNGYNLPKE